MFCAYGDINIFVTGIKRWLLVVFLVNIFWASYFLTFAYKILHFGFTQAQMSTSKKFQLPQTHKDAFLYSLVLSKHTVAKL